MKQALKPAVILVQPQLGENIGMVARAMLNFGLTDLRLVNPRDGWDKLCARKSSAGAEAVIENRKEFVSTKEAVGDLGYVIATTARSRDMVKPVLTPVKAGQMLHQYAAMDVQGGLLYGSERSGLDNDNITLADVICMIPLNPCFSSLNLAQAVLLMGYHWFCYDDHTPAYREDLKDTKPATRSQLIDMFTHLETALDASGFLTPLEKRPAMIRNIKNMLHRVHFTQQDIQTFRGIINSLLYWPDNGRSHEWKRRILAISRGEYDIKKHGKN